MAVTIYHNPRCNSSRRTLALLREKGIEPTIVEYLKTPYTAAQLKTLLGRLKLPEKRLVRKKEAAAAGIDAEELSEEALIAAMVAHPMTGKTALTLEQRLAVRQVGLVRARGVGGGGHGSQICHDLVRLLIG